MVCASTLAKLLPKFLFLSVIRFPHRDHAACSAARCPCDDHHAAAQMPHGDDARLAVVLAVVRRVQGRASEHLGCIGEIKAALFQRDPALLRVKCNPHRAICVPPKMPRRDGPAICVPPEIACQCARRNWPAILARVDLQPTTDYYAMLA